MFYTIKYPLITTEASNIINVCSGIQIFHSYHTLTLANFHPYGKMDELIVRHHRSFFSVHFRPNPSLICSQGMSFNFIRTHCLPAQLILSSLACIIVSFIHLSS